MQISNIKWNTTHATLGLLHGIGVNLHGNDKATARQQHGIPGTFRFWPPPIYFVQDRVAPQLSFLLVSCVVNHSFHFMRTLKSESARYAVLLPCRCLAVAVQMPCRLGQIGKNSLVSHAVLCPFCILLTPAMVSHATKTAMHTMWQLRSLHQLTTLDTLNAPQLSPPPANTQPH